MSQYNPDAAYDCLFLISTLGDQQAGISSQELHLFSYLSCLLWVYRERPIADWGYQFVGTELGAPFSYELENALNAFMIRGFVMQSKDTFTMTQMAAMALQKLQALEMNQDRSECLVAACSSTVAFSTGMVNSALGKEPELSRAKALPATRALLGERAREHLYVQFDALRSALAGKGPDLRLPAIVWLSALYQVEKEAISI